MQGNKRLDKCSLCANLARRETDGGSTRVRVWRPTRGCNGPCPRDSQTDRRERSQCYCDISRRTSADREPCASGLSFGECLGQWGRHRGGVSRRCLSPLDLCRLILVVGHQDITVPASSISLAPTRHKMEGSTAMLDGDNVAGKHCARCADLL